MINSGSESISFRPTYTAALIQEVYVDVHRPSCVDVIPMGVPTYLSLKYGVSIDLNEEINKYIGAVHNAIEPITIYYLLIFIVYLKSISCVEELVNINLSINSKHKSIKLFRIT